MVTFVEGFWVATYRIELCCLLWGERNSEPLMLLLLYISSKVSLSWEKMLWPILDTGWGWYAEWEVLFSLGSCERTLCRYLEVCLLLKVDNCWVEKGSETLSVSVRGNQSQSRSMGSSWCSLSQWIDSAGALKHTEWIMSESGKHPVQPLWMPKQYCSQALK